MCSLWLKRAAFPLILFCFLAIGCEEIVINSFRVTSPLSIDGSGEDWPNGETHRYAFKNIRFQAANDNASLYLLAEILSDSAAPRYGNAVFTLWLDATGHQLKEQGISFTGDASPHPIIRAELFELSEFGGFPQHLPENRREELNQLLLSSAQKLLYISGTGKVETIPPDGTRGIAFARDLTAHRLSFEFAVSLAADGTMKVGFPPDHSPLVHLGFEILPPPRRSQRDVQVESPQVPATDLRGRPQPYPLADEPPPPRPVREIVWLKIRLASASSG